MRSSGLRTVLVFILLVMNILMAKGASEIAGSVFPGVVLVAIQDQFGQPLSLGSGFFIEDNIIATNMHILEDGSTGYVKIVGMKARYDILGYVAYDLDRDLVLLKVEGTGKKSLPIGDSHTPVIGHKIYVVGNPQGLEGTFSEGIISGVRTINADTIFQITAPISPGSSGGPVLNVAGEVIGVAFASFTDGQNLNFAIPAHYITTLMTELESPQAIAYLPHKKSVTSSSGDADGHIVESVVADNFLWEGTMGATFTFTLRNKLRCAVEDIYCLVIFHDKRNQPLDYSLVHCEEIIPPGLAKRVDGRTEYSVKKLTTKIKTGALIATEDKPYTKLEFRILDFKIIE